MKLPHLCLLVLLLSITTGSFAQPKNPRILKADDVFSWNNPPGEWTLQKLPSTLRHATFESPSMGLKVGYYVYLPKGYDLPRNAGRQYPVVYHLHGGRPGSEKKSISLSSFVNRAIASQVIPPTIYIFPNGGPMSWYNYPQKRNGLGEDVLIKELIPHVDATYRTFGTRGKRALEGFSQGGRGTTRIMFKYPGLFGSVAPGGSGYEPEMRIRDNRGAESDKVRFEPGNDAWTLARKFAGRSQAHRLPILLWVGSKGFNYEYNLKYSAYLRRLGLDHQLLVVPDAPHSARIIYEKQGVELMKFHQRNFAFVK